VAFGPTGQENHSIKLSTATKRLALRQALSLAAKEDRVKVIDSFVITDGKSKSAASLLKKIDAQSGTLVVVASKEDAVARSLNNLAGVQLIQAKYLNTYDVLNSNCLVFEKSALDTVNEWLGGSK
jgi:large subunit ribosomal protein L4